MTLSREIGLSNPKSMLYYSTVSRRNAVSAIIKDADDAPRMPLSTRHRPRAQSGHPWHYLH